MCVPVQRLSTIKYLVCTSTSMFINSQHRAFKLQTHLHLGAKSTKHAGVLHFFKHVLVFWMKKKEEPPNLNNTRWAKLQATSAKKWRKKRRQFFFQIRRGKKLNSIDSVAFRIVYVCFVLFFCDLHANCQFIECSLPINNRIQTQNNCNCNGGWREEKKTYTTNNIRK